MSVIQLAVNTDRRIMETLEPKITTISELVTADTSYSKWTFKHVEFDKCVFVQCNMTQMNAKYSTWVNCEFNSVDMSRSNFAGSSFVNCKFTKCKYVNCDFKRVIFNKCKFDDDELLFEDVKFTDVENCSFKFDHDHMGCLLEKLSDCSRSIANLVSLTHQRMDPFAYVKPTPELKYRMKHGLSHEQMQSLKC
jgi:uncharacterized protein YjbI with pentapeptide repeats